MLVMAHTQKVFLCVDLKLSFSHLQLRNQHTGTHARTIGAIKTAFSRSPTATNCWSDCSFVSSTLVLPLILLFSPFLVEFFERGTRIFSFGYATVAPMLLGSASRPLSLALQSPVFFFFNRNTITASSSLRLCAFIHMYTGGSTQTDTHTIHWQLWTWNCSAFYVPTVCVSLPQLCPIVQTLMAGRPREKDVKDEGNGPKFPKSAICRVQSFSFFLSMFSVPFFFAISI